MILDRSIPPISKEIPVFNIPPSQKHILSNGLKVLIVQDNSQPLVNIGISIPMGAAQEHIPGLGRCVAKLMVMGNSKKNAEQIAQQSDIIGASFGVSCNWDSTDMNALVLATYTRDMIQLMSECLLYSTFPDDEIKRRKQLILADLEYLSTDPEYLVSRACNGTLYENHTYGHSRNGTASTINSIQSEDCKHWHSSLIQTSGAFFIISGNCDIESILNMLEEFFGTWKPKNKPILIEKPEFNIGKQLVFAEKKGAVQTSLQIAMPSISLYHPDYTLFQICSTIFGGYFASRLNVLLREKHGYTYGAYSYQDTRKACSSYIIQTNIGNEVSRHSVEEILRELQRMSNEPILEEECTIATQYLLGSMVQGMETAQQLSGRAKTIESYNLPEDYFTQKFADLSKASAQDLLAIQKQFFAPETLIIAASGDIDILTEQLSAFGNPHVFTESDV